MKEPGSTRVLSVFRGLPQDGTREAPGPETEAELAERLRVLEETVPRFFARMHYVSLPDAEVGFAVLTEEEGVSSLDVHSEGYDG